MRLAPLFYVSPVQINFEIPPGMSTGTATVTIQNQNGAMQTATISVRQRHKLQVPRAFVIVWHSKAECSREPYVNGRERTIGSMPRGCKIMAGGARSLTGSLGMRSVLHPLSQRMTTG